MNHYTLSDLIIYPIKSLAGIHLNHWQVTRTGLMYDRQWMLIDNERQFLSQRRLSKMALIKTALTDTQLIVSAPNQQNLALDLKPDLGGIINSTIWQDECAARHISKEADLWFSNFLNTSCRLVYLPSNEVRAVDNRYALPTDQTSFSDGFPFLLVSEASLQSLNQAMQFEIGMNRFRPNLVISGCEAYAEDSWREIRIGNIEFRLPKPCSRCVIPTINPDTAKTDKEPLATLNRLRKWQNKVYFGQNALHNRSGILQVGDTVEIVLTGEKQPLI